MGESTETVSKDMAVITYVHPIANKDTKKGLTHFLNTRIIIDPLFSTLLSYSEKNMTPTVAKADNQRDRSKAALGVNKTIINTDTVSEVKESCVEDSKYSMVDIRSIKPALVTETDIPVRIIYATVKQIMSTDFAFLPDPTAFKSIFIPKHSIARCIPLSAST